jgi:hypothetical protein
LPILANLPPEFGWEVFYCGWREEEEIDERKERIGRDLDPLPDDALGRFAAESGTTIEQG